MNFINDLAEGIAFFIAVIFLFNLFTQFLQALGLYNADQIRILGIISMLLATDNLLTKKFLGLSIF